MSFDSIRDCAIAEHSRATPMAAQAAAVDKTLPPSDVHATVSAIGTREANWRARHQGETAAHTVDGVSMECVHCRLSPASSLPGSMSLTTGGQNKEEQGQPQPPETLFSSMHQHLLSWLPV